MDEEKKKIDVSKLFERVESADTIAGNALSKANQNFSSINNLQMLIQNISVSISDIKQNIRDIANYIIVERKVEEDRRLDEKFEAQDEQQKKEMLDRARALGQSAPPTTPQQEEPVTAPKGGFLSGLLKAIAVGGIIALAAPLIPVIAPMLLTAMAVGIGAIALGIVGAEIVKLLPKIGKKIKESFDASMKFARESIDKLGAKFNDLKNSIGNFLSDKKDQILDFAGDTIDATKTKIGEVTDLVVDVKDKVVNKSTKFLKSAKDKAESVVGSVKKGFTKTSNFLSGIGENILGVKDNIVDKVTDVKDNVVDKVTDKTNDVVESMKEGRKNIFGNFQKLADRATGNIFDFDKSGEGTTGPLRVMTGLADQALNAIGIESDLDRRGTDTGNSLNKPIVQADAPFQSGAPLIPTTSPINFVKTIDNSHLSISKFNRRDTLIPPEVAKLIQ